MDHPGDQVTDDVMLAPEDMRPEWLSLDGETYRSLVYVRPVLNHVFRRQSLDDCEPTVLGAQPLVVAVPLVAHAETPADGRRVSGRLSAAVGWFFGHLVMWLP